VIPARGGSKGIPRKNLQELGGRPLLEWSISAARLSGAVARIIVSTDSEEIAGVARAAGAEAPFLRPATLASDEIHSVHVVLHALDWLEAREGAAPELVMMLLPTSPFRRPVDVRGAVDLLKTRKAQSVVSVVDLGKYPTNLRYLRGERLEYVVPEVERNAQRQGLEKLYAVNGSIFLARSSALGRSGTFHIDGALGYAMAPLNSVDINSPEDLASARRLCSVMDPWAKE
jgi:CMP-N-acetylneuraminic acid synthetase